MLKKALALAAAGVFLSGAAYAGPKKSAKVTDVRVCPMMGVKVTNPSGPTSTVGNYRVHFCCAGCKPEFDKLSAAEKKAKVAEALKKQNAGKKG